MSMVSGEALSNASSLVNKELNTLMVPEVSIDQPLSFLNTKQVELFSLDSLHLGVSIAFPIHCHPICFYYRPLLSLILALFYQSKF